MKYLTIVLTLLLAGCSSDKPNQKDVYREAIRLEGIKDNCESLAKRLKATEPYIRLSDHQNEYWCSITLKDSTEVYVDEVELRAMMRFIAFESKHK